MKKVFILSIISAAIISCSVSEEDRHANDLEKAINQLENRIEQQEKVIIEQDRAIKVITGNIEAANSEGMREEYRKEIMMKELMKQRALTKVLNMDSMLYKLREIERK